MAREYRAAGWQEAVGSSGTARALETILRENGYADEGITREGLERLKSLLLKHERADPDRIAGLRKDRAAVIPGGLAIMLAAFDELGIERMAVSDGALRHGVLYDLLGRVQHRDMREATVAQFMRRYHVDAAQAERVRLLALQDLRFDRQAKEEHEAGPPPARLGGAPGRDRPVDRARPVPQALGLHPVQRRHARLLAHGAAAPGAHRARAPRQARQDAGRGPGGRRLDAGVRAAHRRAGAAQPHRRALSAAARRGRRHAAMRSTCRRPGWTRTRWPPRRSTPRPTTGKRSA